MLVYYSVVPDDPVRLLRQITQSLRSIRAHDTQIDVAIAHCGPPSAALAHEAARNNAVIYQDMPFLNVLADYTPHSADLRRYQPLHKWLALRLLQASDATLLVDCDTYFSASPRKLLALYSGANLYACAEVFSAAFTPLCRNDWHLNETALADIVHAEGVRPIRPFNTGAVLMDRKARTAIASSLPLFISYVTRLLGHGDAIRPPTQNVWIVEQIALWLALGHSDITTGHFKPEHVPLANGFIFEPAAHRVVSHYFTGNETEFFAQNRLLLPGQS